jgi:hypothetical protein
MVRADGVAGKVRAAMDAQKEALANGLEDWLIERFLREGKTPLFC